MNNVKEFFNKVASSWDERSNNQYIDEILKLIEIKENYNILDVACGTGILEKYLLEYDPKEILGIDFSENMIEIAKIKNNDSRVKYLCDDIFSLNDGKFDLIIIFNAFPHFDNKKDLLSHLSNYLNEDGKIVICHNFRRTEIDNIHDKIPESISSKLLKGEEFKKIIPNSLKDELILDGEKFYIVILKNKI